MFAMHTMVACRPSTNQNFHSISKLGKIYLHIMFIVIIVSASMFMIAVFNINFVIIILVVKWCSVHFA